MSLSLFVSLSLWCHTTLIYISQLIHTHILKSKKQAQINRMFYKSNFPVFSLVSPAMWSSLLLHRWSGSSMATSRCSLRTDHTTTTTTTTHQDHPASVFSPPSSSYLSAHVWQSPHTCTLFFYRPRWYKTHLHKNWDWSKNVKETQVYVMVQMEKYVNKSMLSTDSSGTTT